VYTLVVEMTYECIVEVLPVVVGMMSMYNLLVM